MNQFQNWSLLLKERISFYELNFIQEGDALFQERIIS